MEGHQRGTSARTAHDPRRPSLERPSLFAGPDDDTTDADGLRSVRILSTLESQERGKGAPSRRTAQQRAAGRPHPRVGTQRLLWALVVMGLASAGAALWWASARWHDDTPPSSNPAAAQRAPAVKVATSPSATTSATPPPDVSASAASAPSAGTPLAALIENTPPAAGPTVLAIARPAEAASSTAPARQAAKVIKADAADKAEKAGKTKVRSKPTDPPKHTPRDKRTHSDRDVELLEAVMSHTERRQRP